MPTEKAGQGEAGVIIEAFVQKIFEGFSINPQIRTARADRILNDIHLFVRELPDGTSTAELTDILNEEFGDPDFIREIYLRDDTRLPARSDRMLLTVHGCVLFGYLCLLLAVKGAEYYAGLHYQIALAPISAAIAIALSPFVGVAAYVANWLVSGNRYRIAPFVVMSTVVFFLAMTAHVEFDFIERRPVERVHFLATFAIPILSLEFKPVICRTIVDVDRTGLPPSLTRSRLLVIAHSESTMGMLQIFWLLVGAVAIGNFYLISRLADDLSSLRLE